MNIITPQLGDSDLAGVAALSYFDNAFEKAPSDDTSLQELIALIQSGRWHSQVDAVRECLRSGGPNSRNEYDRQKRALPAVMISGFVAGQRSKAAEEGRFTHSGLLQGDFDGKDHPHLSVDGIMDLLRADPHVVAAFISPSGEGVKAVIKIAADTSLHRGSFEAAAEHFAKFGLKIDEATKDPGRLCFVSSDPAAWYRDPAAAPSIKPKKQAARAESSFDPLDATYEDIKEMLAFIPPRPDYEDWLRIASAVWSVLDETTGIKLLNEWSPEEKSGEYLRKFKNRLRDVRVGTLAWYAQAHGFDAKEAARRKRWAGRIRFADGKSSTIRENLPAPDNADGPAKLTDFGGEGPEDMDNPQFVEHCLEKQQRGDAEIWLSAIQGIALYDHAIKRWRWFDGGIWITDRRKETEYQFQEIVCSAYNRLAIELTKDIAAKPSDDPKRDPRRITRKSAEDRVRMLNRDGWKKGSMAIAETIPRLTTFANEFDRHPHLLAVENGVLDFDAGEFREAHPSDMLTHRAGVKFDPTATCPKFDAFLLRMLVDPEVVAFVLRAMAYSLTGKVDEDVLFFCYGKGANGKSTFMLIFKLLLGELMTMIDVETLLARRADSSVDYKKSMLEGRRVAMTDEVPENRKLSESMVKSLIGGDEIVARRPYEQSYSFVPTHKLWMVGNHKPTIEGTDAGIWRRICLIPWTQTIPVAERRPRAEIIAEFRLELPGILNRLLLAWLQFREIGGLKPPSAVLEATEQYRSEHDQLGQFLAERTEPNPLGAVLNGKLHKAYLAWCEDNGEKPRLKTTHKFAPALREKGLLLAANRSNAQEVQGIELTPLNFTE